MGSLGYFALAASAFPLGRRKKPVLVNLSPDLVLEARGKGLNFSKILENALKEYLRRLNDSENEKEAEKTVSEFVVRPPGFEPGSPAWQA